MLEEVALKGIVAGDIMTTQDDEYSAVNIIWHCNNFQVSWASHCI